MNQKVSVIIACRNGSNYLAEAIAGLGRQDMDMEIIVVDDGSTDDTAKLAAGLGCTVRSIPHSGTSAARNVGIRMAHGEFILFHDHDDIMRPRALRQMSDVLIDDSSLFAVMAQAKDFISPELSLSEKSKHPLRPEPYFGYLSGAVIFRKKQFIANGLAFDESLITGETIDLLIRVKDSCLQVHKIPFVSVDRRIHRNNKGQTMRNQEFNDYAALLRRRMTT